MIRTPIHSDISCCQNEWEGSASEEDEQQNEQGQDMWGDELVEVKEENTIRIYFQNLNGIKWDKDGGNWPAICQAMAGVHADIIGFAEVNQNTAQLEVKQTLENIASKYFDHKRIVTGTSNRRVRKTYKPGGTLMMTVMNTVSLVQETTRDRMGRWVSTRYQGLNQQRLTVIMAYQVCQSVRTGNNTAANQQMNMILEEAALQGITTRKNPREAFIEDLTRFIQERQVAGDLILLLGDFNEPVTATASGMTQLLGNCTLVDIFGARLGNTRNPSTYKRGHSRIDYALASPTLYQCIKKAGYEPFDYRGIFSDHRGMYLDLMTDELFGSGPVKLATKTQREFSADRPEKVVQYIENKYTELLNHNMLQRVQQLEDLDHPDHAFAEKIDRDMVRAARKAAKAARTKYRTPWSPKLARMWATIHLLKMIKSQLKMPHLDNWKSIQVWRDNHDDMPMVLPRTIQEVEEQLKAAYSELRAIRQEAEQHRQEYLEDRMRMYEALEQTDRAKIVRRIKRAETLHKCYRKLRYVRNGRADTGLVEVQVPRDSTVPPQQCPKEDTLWRTVRAPPEVKRILLQRNRTHFGQAMGTPLTDSDFLAEVKFDGSGLTADMILEGEYDASDLDRVSRLFVRHMIKQTTIQLPSLITKESFIGKLKAWPEKTTTSPSGIHLGHYQALWKRHNINSHDDPSNIKEFESKREMIIRIHVALINYAIKFGYSYERWQKVVNVMLRKDKTNSYIHRLRVIHLYEADYNLMLAVKWREAIFHAEDNHLLNEGLYGSRPGRSAHEPVLIEIFQNEIYKASMKSGIHKDLDATSCYDRILPWIASICSRRVGVHHQVALVNCRTLERARFHLKTSIDVSEEFYKHCETYPIFGTGQGSGNSPFVWCFVASALFDAFAEQAHGATFYSHDGKQMIQLFMIGFVDDCSQQVNQFRAHPQPNEAELVRRMRKDAQLWSDLLWSSGGALEIPKCSFQLIQSDWTSRGRPFLKGHCTAPPLIISNAEGHLQVKQLSNYEARRSLGVHLSPSGMMKRQYEELIKKSHRFAEAALANALTRKESNIMFHGIFLPSITYPFPATSLSEGQCHAIETPFLKVILPRCGFNRSMSRAIRFAPIQFGGAGFQSLYMEQSIHLITTAMKYLRCPQSQAGKLLMIALSWAQAYAGVSWSIWQHPERKIPATPTPWIMAVRQALAKVGARLTGQAVLMSVPKSERINDWHIMDTALTITRFSNTELEDINAYRRFYQAVTATDITDERGTKIRADVWTGTGEPHPADFTAEFFNQPRPGKQALRTWKKFLHLVAYKDRTLKQRLGQWTVTHTECRRRPAWVHDAFNQNLYYRVDAEKYIKCERQFRSYAPPARHTSVWEIPPQTARPVAVIEIGQSLMVGPTAASPSVPIIAASNFTQHIGTLEPWERQLLQATCLSGTPEEIITRINDGSIVFVASDGSVIERSYASFGFTIIHVVSKQRIVTGQGPVPGHQPSSFRAEAYGVLALSRLLLQLTEFTGMQISQNVCHWIDNQSVVHRLKRELEKQYPLPNSTLAPDWDVVYEIAKTLEQLPNVQYQLKWIKSHQDSSQPYADLTLAAQGNCDADKLASAFHDTLQGRQSQKVVPILPNTRVHLEIQGTTIVGHHKSELRQAAHLPPLLAYLQARFEWGHEVIQTLDWEAFRAATQSYDEQRATLVKHVHSIAPTAKYVHRNDSHESAQCPSCSCEVETNDHVILCPAASRKNWRESTIARLMTTSQSVISDPVLEAILVAGVTHCFRDDGSGLCTQQYPPEYARLIQQQNAIGWMHLFRGRWTKEWKQCQYRWARSRPIPNAVEVANKWVHLQSRTMLDQWWKLWKLRNEERHGWDTASREARQRPVIQSKLEELYSYRDKMMQVDTDVFPYPTAQAHMEAQQSLTSLHEWCMDNGPAIRASCTQAQKLGITGTGDIRSYLDNNHSETDSASAEDTDGS